MPLCVARLAHLRERQSRCQEEDARIVVTVASASRLSASVADGFIPCSPLLSGLSLNGDLVRFSLFARAVARKKSPYYPPDGGNRLVTNGERAVSLAPLCDRPSPAERVGET